MLDASGFGNIGHQLSLLLFLDVLELCQFMRKIVGDREEAVRPLQGFLQNRFIGDIALLEMDVGAQFEKGLRRGLAGIASQCADLSM